VTKTSKFDSRKYTLAFYTILSATVMTLLPPVLTFWWTDTLTIMSGTEWSAFVGTALLFYGGQNVMQKKFETDKQSPELEE